MLIHCRLQLCPAPLVDVQEAPAYAGLTRFVAKALKNLCWLSSIRLLISWDMMCTVLQMLSERCISLALPTFR